jgi:hypothetical protein
MRASPVVKRSTTGSSQIDSLDPLDDFVDARARQQRRSSPLDTAHHLAKVRVGVRIPSSAPEVLVNACKVPCVGVSAVQSSASLR